jgi:hypothetical protein
VSNAFMIDAGLLIPPFCRNCLESAASQLALDFSSYLFLQSGPTQSVGGRDTGFQAMGYLAGGRLEYRAGVFQGFRQSDARNPLRTTARVQYDVWDIETGYVYPGTLVSGFWFLVSRVRFGLLHFLGQSGKDGEEIAHDAEIGDAEDGSLGIFVDGDDVLRGGHAGEMLDGAGDARCNVEIRTDNPTGLTDLMLMIDPAGVDSGP